MGTLIGNPNGGLVLSATIPDDGTTVEAGDVNVPLGVALDGLAYLGTRGLIARYTYSYDDDTTLIPFETFTGTGYSASTTMLLDVPGLIAGDIVLVDVFANIALNGNGAGSTHFGELRLAATQGFGGGGPSTAAVPGARVHVRTTASTTTYHPLGLVGEVVVTTAGTMRIFVQGRILVTGDSMQIYTAARVRALHLRKVL